MASLSPRAPAAGSFIDAGLASKTTCYYRLFAVGANGIYAAGNEVSGGALAGISTPSWATWSPPAPTERPNPARAGRA